VRQNNKIKIGKKDQTLSEDNERIDMPRAEIT
jgi:hypothetical protein